MEATIVGLSHSEHSGRDRGRGYRPEIQAICALLVIRYGILSFRFLLIICHLNRIRTVIVFVLGRKRHLWRGPHRTHLESDENALIPYFCKNTVVFSDNFKRKRSLCA